MRRILVISVDGQSAPNPNWPRQRIVSGLGQIISAVTSTQIGAYNLETLIAVESAVDDLVGHLRTLRCRQGPVIEGYPCGDVAGKIMRVSLSDYPDPEMRARLVAIRTGLTLPREQIDELVAAGETMIGRDAATIAAFLGPAPPAKMAAGAAVRLRSRGRRFAAARGLSFPTAVSGPRDLPAHARLPTRSCRRLPCVGVDGQAAHLGRLLGQCPERLRHTAAEQRRNRIGEFAGGERPRRIARRNSGVHQHAGIAIASHHAGVAGVAPIRDAVEVEYRTHRFVPRLAAPDVEVPVQVKIFVAADARHRLRFAADIARDLGERCARVEHRKTFAQPTDRVKGIEQFVMVEIDQE